MFTVVFLHFSGSALKKIGSYQTTIFLSKHKYNFFKSLKFTFSNILISDISFPLKSNPSNFLNFTFSNTFISDILFKLKFNIFNSLKLTFSNILISDILFVLKSNISNFSNLLFLIYLYLIFH